MNRHRITTDLRDGGLGLRQIWWAFVTRWISIGQQEIRNVGPSEQQLSATQCKYLDAVRDLGGSAGQRISRPRIHVHTDPYLKGYLTLKARKRTTSNRRAGYR